MGSPARRLSLQVFLLFCGISVAHGLVKVFVWGESLASGAVTVMVAMVVAVFAATAAEWFAGRGEG